MRCGEGPAWVPAWPAGRSAMAGAGVWVAPDRIESRRNAEALAGRHRLRTE